MARELVGILSPCCERLVVAGSLRRGKAQVSDVELLYLPITRPNPEDLFGSGPRLNLVEEKLALLVREGSLAPRVNKHGSAAWGAENKLAVHTASGMPVDFFAACERTWITRLVCRTGGAQTNIRIAEAAKRQGFHWNPYQGFSGLALGRVQPQSEQELFDLVGLPYLEPKERE